MVTKQDRHNVIRQLVASGPVSTQAELVKGLRKKGMAVNQATLSRDLVELSIRKSGGRYVVADEDRRGPGEVDLAAAVYGFVACGPHLIVIRTAVGQAQAVGVKVDTAADPSITGVLAGDDTIFVATKNRRSQTVALRRLEHWFGDKHEH